MPIHPGKHWQEPSMGLQVPLLAQEQSWAQSCPKCPPAHTVGTGQPGICPPTRNPQTTTHSCIPRSSQVTAMVTIGSQIWPGAAPPQHPHHHLHLYMNELVSTAAFFGTFCQGSPLTRSRLRHWGRVTWVRSQTQVERLGRPPLHPGQCSPAPVRAFCSPLPTCQHH